MKRSMPLFVTALLFLVEQPLLAQCGCADAPCEEVTLSSVASENPELTGFGAELSPVTSVQPTGMTLQIGYRTPSVGERFAGAMVMGLLLLPFAFLVRRLLSCNEPMLRLGVQSPEIEREPQTAPDLSLVPDGSETSRDLAHDSREFSSLGMEGNVLPFPTAT